MFTTNVMIGVILNTIFSLSTGASPLKTYTNDTSHVLQYRKSLKLSYRT